MNISVYLNDGKVISSVDINEATVEEALSAIRAFGFGEKEEEWLYSDNQKIRYRVEDLDTRRSIGRQLLELEEERDKWKNDYNESVLYYNGLINKHIDECDEWKEKYKIECQNNDAIKKSYDRLTDSFENLLRDRDEWREKYAIECKHNKENKKAYDQLVKDFTVITNERDEWKRKWERCKGNVEAFEELLKERDEYKEIASDRDDLKIENDKVKELCDMLQDEKDELQKMFNFVREDLFKANHQASELIAENDKLKTALVGVKRTCATLEQDILFWKNRWESEFEEGVRVKKELEECKQKKSES